MTRWLSIVLLLGIILLCAPCAGQQLLIDQGRRVEGLWCFPLATNPKVYLYLPSQARLSLDRNSGPEFSFLRYVENVKSQEESSSTITQATGGGILHFLALYETPEASVKAAAGSLKKLLDDEEVELRGPVVFASGRYAIISSVAKVDDPSQPGGRKMIATGNAPVLEGNKIAVSFDLDREDAQILYNSFQMANPDVSVVFEMQFEGLADAYDATLDVDWTEMSKDQQLSAGVKVYWVGADVDIAFQRLLRNNTIKLVTRGEDATSEALLTSVYNKLLELLFRKVEEAPPAKQESGLTDALTNAIGGAVKKVMPFSLSAAYRLKDMQSSGHTTMSFNHQATTERTTLITFNIGDLFKRYGQNSDYFKVVNLSDPVYSQREVFVSVDGSLLADFDKYINNVVVTIKKDHEAGASTIGEVMVDRRTFTQSANRFSVVYGWNGDNDRTKWLDYQYQVRWSFRDGGTVEEDWQTTSSPMINVTPAYERREISIEGDVKALADAGVKFALVTIRYDFFGKPKQKQVKVKIQGDSIEENIEIIQPKGQYDYQYEIKWYLANGNEVSKPLTDDNSGFILIDELPE